MFRATQRLTVGSFRASKSNKNLCTTSKRVYSDDSMPDKRVTFGRFPSMMNWGINFLPAGHEYVVERFGKFHSVQKPGLCLQIPFIDKFSYVVDTRELCIRIEPEIATSADNVFVTLGGNIYLRFFDTHNAAYGASKPLYAASQFAQSVMRTAVGDLNLDKLFSERGHLNTMVKAHMEEGIKKWGCEIIRFEITDLEPVDRAVKDSLHKQSTAERDRREIEITAGAHKKKVELEADAYKYQQVAEATGDAEKVKLAADASAYEIEKKAKAQENSINMIGSALQGESGDKVVKYLLSKDYIQEFGKLANQSNTMIIPQDMSNLASMIGTGYSVFDKITNKTTEE